MDHSKMYALNLLEGKGFNGATLAIAALALLVAIVAAYFAREALFPPKRRLNIHILTPARLLSNAQGRVEGIEVLRNGHKLPDPHLITIVIKNTGRHAVASEQFDQGRPIKIELGSPIEALLDAQKSPAPTGIVVTKEGVLVGPELIRRRQEVIVQVLTAEAPKDLSDAVREHLIDTEVKVEAGGYTEMQGGVPQKVAAWLAVAGTTAGLVTLFADIFTR